MDDAGVKGGLSKGTSQEHNVNTSLFPQIESCPESNRERAVPLVDFHVSRSACISLIFYFDAISRSLSHWP